MVISELNDIVFKRAIESSGEGIILTDRVGKILYVNRSALNILDYNDDVVVISKNVDDVLRLYRKNGEKREIAKIFQDVLEKKTSITLKNEVECLGFNGEYKSINLNISPFETNEEIGKAVMIFFCDNTEGKKIKEELTMAKELAIAANNAKSEFLANVSHEIRTPLNGIIGMTNITLMSVLTEDQRENLDMIKSSADALLKIINGVLDFSKIEAGKLVIEKIPFNLDAVLTRVEKAFKVQLREKYMTYKTVVEDGVISDLVGDPNRLVQILNNLIGNAIKFTEKGIIEVSVEKILKKEDKILLKFNIRDTGVGVREEVKDKIFDSFSQADGSITRRYGGTGLGLAISKKLVEMMGGHIGFSSEYKKGSVFYFTMPFMITDLTSNHAEVSEHRVIEQSLYAYNILLVEDDPINQTLATTLLKKKGYNVTLAENGKEATEIFDESKFDLILMDISMPVMDGIEATKIIRKQHINSHVPIIALTAHAVRGDKEKFLAVGMDGYISKPIDLNDFYHTIATYLSNGTEEEEVDAIIKKIEGSDRRKNSLVVEDIQKVAKQVREYILDIETGKAKKDYFTIGDSAHSIKLIADSVGLENLKKYALKMEMACRVEKMEDVERSFYEINEEVRRLTFLVNAKGIGKRGIRNEDINSRG